MIRRRKAGSEKKPQSSSPPQSESGENKDQKGNLEAENAKLNVNGNESSKDLNWKSSRKSRGRSWNCLDSCCWFVGCICSIWWLLLFSYKAMPASFPQYVTEAITGPLPDPPGVKLAKEGLKAKHPVVFVPGIVTGGLELWEGHQCAEGLFRKRLWGGTFGEIYRR